MYFIVRFVVIFVETRSLILQVFLENILDHLLFQPLKDQVHDDIITKDWIHKAMGQPWQGKLLFVHMCLSFLLEI